MTPNESLRDMGSLALTRELIAAARRLEYFQHFGRHGDGKDREAERRVSQLRLEIVRRLIAEEV